MPALDALASWPVDRVAGAVVDRARRRGRRPGDTGWRTRIASVTKPLVALACLVAVEEGTLELDAPAGPPGSTVRHLLAHASGLPFEGAAPVSPPGRRRIYSNTGFDVLGDTLAAAAGIPVATYLHEAVAVPLGMGRTELRGSPAKDAWSTVDDLVRFAAELLAPRLVAPETLAEATSEQFPGLAGVVPGLGSYDPNPWGLGFEIKGAKSPALDRSRRLAPHVRPLRRGGHVPVGRPRRRRGLRGAHQPRVRRLGAAAVVRLVGRGAGRAVRTPRPVGRPARR